MKRHVRLLEALGILTTLVAWGLNTLSVQHWDSIEAEHRRIGDRATEAYTSSQITANVMLNAAVMRVAINSSDQEGTELAFVRTWHSLDVRRAWLLRLYNSVTGLTVLTGSVRDIDRDNDLQHAAEIQNVAGELSPINDRVQALLGNRKGWIADPTFTAEALPASEATTLDGRMAQLSEQVLTLHFQVGDTIAQHRDRATRIYITAFFIGTLLLAVAKLIEWRTPNSIQTQTSAARFQPAATISTQETPPLTMPAPTTSTPRHEPPSAGDAPTTSAAASGGDGEHKGQHRRRKRR